MTGVRRTAALAGLLVLALGVSGCTKGTTTASAGRSTAVPADVQKVMDKSEYKHSRWGLLVQDAKSGKTLVDLNSNEFFPPGSTTKVFTGLPTWNTLTPEHTFVTPVYATGPVTGSTLSGNLVLVAQGDLVFGGRAGPGNTVAYTDFDHMEANAFPGYAILTPQDPLAAIDALATQIAAAGVTQVSGDVVIDDRLFPAGQELSGITLDPMMINENVIDLTMTGSTAGQPAAFDYRPKVSAQTATSTVTTTAADTAPAVVVTEDAAGNITVSGTVPANGKPIVQVAEVKDPAAYARTALIEALARKGVTVGASTGGANPAQLLPAPDGYGGLAPIARFTSPPYSEYEKLILKVSHNRGADTNMCLLALQNGSTECAAGLPVVRSYVTSLGVDGSGFAFSDGRGGEPADLTTPRAATQLLRAIAKRPDAQELKKSLPILGVDGTIAGDEKGTKAAGNIYAKTGTVAGGDVTSGRLVVLAETLIGYIDAASGRTLVLSLYVTNLTLPDAEKLFGVFADLDHIAALLYDRY